MTPRMVRPIAAEGTAKVTIVQSFLMTASAFAAGGVVSTAHAKDINSQSPTVDEDDARSKWGMWRVLLMLSQGNLVVRTLGSAMFASPRARWRAKSAMKRAAEAMPIGNAYRRSDVSHRLSA